MSSSKRRRTSVKLKVEQNPNLRAHKVLFDDECNFKPKRVKLKTTYNRKIKHSKGIDQHE